MKANELMTWATYKRKYKPEMYQYSDSTFGTISTIKPTMRNAGFKVTDHDIPYDIDIRAKVKELMPKNAVFVVYHAWTWRDHAWRCVSIYFKTDLTISHNNK